MIIITERKAIEPSFRNNNNRDCCWNWPCRKDTLLLSLGIQIGNSKMYVYQYIYNHDKGHHLIKTDQNWSINKQLATRKVILWLKEILQFYTSNEDLTLTHSGQNNLKASIIIIYIQHDGWWLNHNSKYHS